MEELLIHEYDVDMFLSEFCLSLIHLKHDTDTYWTSLA